MPSRTKAERLALIYAKLQTATPCGSHGEAFSLMERLFNEVEDSYADVPFELNAHALPSTGGRMYAPHPDFLIDQTEIVSVYRHRMGHKTYIGRDGSIRITRKEATGEETVVFEKLSASGCGYWHP